ncbi:MAG: polysaccharide deacetylase family protein [Candidatus Limnocylindrales bacterium]
MPPAFVRDARAASQPLVWAGFQLDQLVPAADVPRRGFRVDGYQKDSKFVRVRYRNVLLTKGTGDLARLVVTDPARAVSPAVALDPENRETPYVVHAGNVWAFADFPFAYLSERDRYLAFCDLLHDILGVPHAENHRALIRIEDVTPEDDVRKLRASVAALVKENVPFQISLVPIFRDPATTRDVTLSDRPQLVQALHDAVAGGGTIVLHGSSHQYRGVTPADFEFWDSERNAPREDDSAELVRVKIATALDECFRNNLYPVAWEMPHYTASMVDYAEVARVFSTIYERILTIEEQGTQQFFPYPTYDSRGSLVVPESLGYLPAANPDPAVLVGNAEALLAVRDGIASGYVHDFLDPQLFGQVIRGVKALGYQYSSLRDFPASVSTGGRLVLTHGASGTLSLDDEYLHEFIFTPDGKQSRVRDSAAALRGEVSPTMTPAVGEVLVAFGTVERSGHHPSTTGRIGTWAAALWDRIKRHSPVQPAVKRPLTAAIVWNPTFTGESWNDQESFRSMFVAYGVTPQPIAPAALGTDAVSTDHVLIVPGPSARALSIEQTAAVARFVRSGGQLITDGRSPLAEAVGISYTGRTTSAGNITDLAAPTTALRWRPLVGVEDFRPPRSTSPLASDKAAGTIVMASFQAGAGTVLYLAVLFDPYTPDGTSRFPFLFEHAMDTFGREMPARRSVTELYFDPGLRPGISIEQLVPMWRRQGVRVIYAAGWEFDDNYTYDYDRLLRVAHEQGLLVYAWFEFPQVSRRFWNRHPEWREVPAFGNALPSWRLAMNFSNEACRAAAVQFMIDTVTHWPWDGVNLAELNFDGTADGNQPERFVPMNADVRTAFAAQPGGFDPSNLFDATSRRYWMTSPRGWDAFLAYRQSLVTSWHREFLKALGPFMDSGHEVIVTMLDGLTQPKTSRDSGIGVQDILGILKDVDFTLQVEDPAVAWTGSPRRYETLAARYAPLMPKGRRLMFDINVVPDRRVEDTHLPLAKAAGTEVVAAVRAARSVGSRVAIYGDSTMRARDLELIAAAFADRARVEPHGETWTVETPDAVEVAVPPGVHDFYLEGREWPFWRPGFVLVPPGRHVLSSYRPWFRLLDLSALRPQVLQLSGNLLSASATRGRLQFEYTSDGPGVAVLDRKPQQASIDDRIDAAVTTTLERRAVLTLPRGHHFVDVSGSSRGVLLLDLTSILSSSLIVAFGTAACALLAGLYVSIRVRRFFQARGKQV